MRSNSPNRPQVNKDQELRSPPKTIGGGFDQGVCLSQGFLIVALKRLHVDIAIVNGARTAETANGLEGGRADLCVFFPPRVVDETETGRGQPRLCREQGIVKALAYLDRLPADLAAACGVEIPGWKAQVDQSAGVGGLETSSFRQVHRSFVRLSRIGHLTEDIVRIADALKNLNFQLRVRARRQRGNEFESAPEDFEWSRDGKTASLCSLPQASNNARLARSRALLRSAAQVLRPAPVFRHRR